MRVGVVTPLYDALESRVEMSKVKFCPSLAYFLVTKRICAMRERCFSYVFGPAVYCILSIAGKIEKHWTEIAAVH